MRVSEKITSAILGLCWFAVTALGFFVFVSPNITAKYAQFLVLQDRSFEVCNTTPFDLNYLLIEQRDHPLEDDQLYRIYNRSSEARSIDPLPAGACEAHTLYKPNRSTTLLIRAVTDDARLNDEVIRYVYNSIDPIRISWDGTTNQCVIENPLHKTAALASTTTCPEKAVLQKFIKLDDPFKNSKRPFHIFSAPLINEPSNWGNVRARSKAQNATWLARTMRSTLLNDIKVREDYPDNQYPFHLGVQLVDRNGPLKPGVEVGQTAAKTIFDDSMPLKPGMRIAAINGESIYSPYDVFSALEAHGFSRSHGIRVPLSIETSGDGIIEHVYFFNEKHRRYRGDRTGRVLFYGVVDSLSLGHAAETTCGGRTALVGVANALNFLSNKLSEPADRKEYAKLPDYQECVWRTEQDIGLAIQKNSEMFTASAWLTIFSPGGLRVFADKPLKKKMTKLFGKSRTVRAVTAMSAELAETAIYFANDRSPLQSYADAKRDFVRAIPYISGISFSLGIIGRR